VVAVSSGEKFRNERGMAVIKDGIKAGTASGSRLAKPKWLRARIRGGETFDSVKGIVHEHRLATVCEEAKCPNISECWSAGTATIMLLGDVCTRACRFCAVDTGNPRGWLDPDEPDNTARAVELMGLKYVVLTSVNRDDLPDGGAGRYAQCVRRVKDLNPDTAVEALTPDFLGVLRRRRDGGRQWYRGVRAERGDGPAPYASRYGIRGPAMTRPWRVLAFMRRLIAPTC
jgi:lipoic acid synthetase